VVAAVVGAWTAGSDFSPHPAAATAASAAVTTTSGSSRRLPASGTDLTAQPYPGG
jgi:sugar/nucleoside kinase (ribokinase family)